MNALGRHITDEELISFSRAGLPGERLFEVSDHLGECASCAARAEELVDLDGLAAGIRRDLADVEHPAAEVGDLRMEARSWMPLAASIILVAGLAAGLLWLRRNSSSPPVHGTTVIRPTSHDEVSPEPERAVLSAGHIDRPSVIGELRRTGQAERGKAPSPAERLAPSGVVVESDRPELTWTPLAGAHYTVAIFAGDEPVARSGRLAAARWQPPTALPRGKTYLWQVDVTRADGTTIVLPAPSAPEALFRVADAATIGELETARKAHPGDHLLLGILYARSGMQREAVAELDAHLAQHPGDARAASVADSVRRW
jgi:hypothetical protein